MVKIDDINTKKAISNIKSGNFEDAYKMLDCLEVSEIVEHVLMKEAFDNPDFVYHRFVLFLERYYCNLDVLYQAALLVTTALAANPGAYYLASHHLDRLMRERNQLHDLDLALFVSQTPGRPFGLEKIKSICDRILEIDPSHEEAKNVRQKIR